MRHNSSVYLKVMIILVLSIITVLAVSFPAAAADAPAVLEAPQVRVVINGVSGTYTDVALEINDRIMLPFREVLTKLGVANDDEHIIWNEEEQSVTVVDGGNTVKLQIGSYNMSVNGVEKTFDVAPFFYEKNDRTYVPVRAVSELLDKQIMWEEATTTVYVRDKANYEETIALLEKMRDAEKKTKFQATSDSQINYNITADGVELTGADENGVLKATMNMAQIIMADLDEDIFYVKQDANMGALNIDSEMLFYNNKAFIKMDALGVNWQDAGALGVSIGAPTDQFMFIDSQMEVRPLSDVAMAIAVTKGADGTYSITGEPIAVTDLNMILDIVSSIVQGESLTDLEMNFNKFQIGTTIDSEYNPIKTVALVDFDFSLKEQVEDGVYVTLNFGANINMSITYDYSDPDFEIEIPQEIIDLM